MSLIFQRDLCTACTAEPVPRGAWQHAALLLRPGDEQGGGTRGDEVEQ
jgi:hypothetical protein